MEVKRKRPFRSALALLMAAAMAASTCLPAFAASTPKAAEAYVPTGEHTEWYKGIEIPGVNREPSHAQFIPYEDRSLALENEASSLDEDAQNSAYYQLLSGKDWDFALVKTPEEADQKDAAYLAETLDEQAAQDFTPEFVPQAWQTYKDEDGNFKYFDEPMYTNSIYPWGSIVLENGSWQKVNYRDPQAPTQYNPVGFYRTAFTTPKDWDGREIFVSFQSVCSAYYLYVNGQYVGYTTDSYTAHDFNITPYLNAPGEENTIALKVYRWSIGSYLENQDYINMSGIFRDVYLYSKDDVELRDFFVRTALDDRADKNSDATLELDVDVRGLHNAEAGDYSVEATLLDMDDTEIESATLGPVHIEATEPSTEQTQEAFLEKVASTGKTVTGSMRVDNPDKWFPDTPNLYKLLIELKDEEGKVIETAVQRVGFREIYKVNINEAGQEQMQITGEKAVFRGTNRHDTNIETGRAVTRDDILQDLTMMKQYNVNSIRTSHYPNDKLLYELADEMGLFICCEANIESHYGGYINEYQDASQVIPSGSKKWVATVVDRTDNMLELYKNHPSIVMWSLGNEATYTKHNYDENYCFWVSSQRVLERDPSRLRMYERESDNYYHRYQKDEGADPMDMEQRRKNIVDVHSTQYPTQSAVESYANNPDYKMPYMQQEYAHAMGQALGGFKEFWDLVREYPNLQGGFIWDWVDQSVTTPLPENQTTYTIKDVNTGTEASLSAGTSWTDGRNNTQAIQGGYLTVNRGSNLKAKGEALTMEVWIKTDRIPSGKDEGFISTGDNGLGLKVNSRGGNAYFELFVDGWAAGTATTAGLPENFTDGSWHQLAGVCAADKSLHFYWDGKELENTGAKFTTASAPFDSANTALTVGLDSASSDRVFGGAIDSVRIYQKALTAEELQSESRTKDDADVVYWLDFAGEEVETHETNYDWLEDKLGNSYWGYGGDWIDRYSNADAFCANGLIFADRSPSAKVVEVRKVHQQVNFYSEGNPTNGKFRIVNEFENTNLDQYDVFWKLTEDTKTIGEEQDMDLSLAPNAETTVQLNLPEFTPKAGSDYILEFSVRYREDTSWAKAGDELAFEQIPLSYETDAMAGMDLSAMQEFGQVTENETELHLEGATTAGQEFSIALDKKTGVITNYSLDGTTILEKGPVPSYWRAQTYNDITNSFPTELRNAEDTMQNIEVTVQKNENNKCVSVSISEDLLVDASNYVTYDIYSNGEIVVSNQLVPHSNFAPGDNNQPALPKVGMRMQVAKGFENLEYYGRGPEENYCDRNTGYRLGVYNSTVDEQFEYKYMKPQENGNRTDVRWTSLTDEAGTGLMVTADGSMETSAQHYTAEELNPALDSHPYNSSSSFRHPYQVTMREDTIWCIDYKQRGVSNTAFFGHVPLDPYRLDTDKTYTHAFRISPVAGSTDKMAGSKVAVQPSTVAYPITDIQVNGVSLPGFDPMKMEYTMEVNANAGTPKVTATTAMSSIPVKISVEGDTATVKAALSGETKIYTIRFTLVDVVYVSDLDQGNWVRTGGGNLTADHTAFNKALSLNYNGKTTSYEKGLSMQHPDATYESRRVMQVEIPIEGMGYERFKAVAGVDTVTPNWASLQINVITTDGNTVSILPNTGWMTGTSAALGVDIELPGNAKALVLIAEMDNSSVVVDFADARFVNSVKPSPKALEVTYSGKQASLFVNDEEQKLANLTGSYKAELTPDGKTTLTFIPAVEGREFAGVSVNGEAQKNFTADSYTMTIDGLPTAAKYDLAFTVVNKQILRTVLTAAEALNGGKEYLEAVPSVQKKFDAALKNAQEIEKQLNASQKDIDGAWKDLLHVIQFLSFAKGDKTALEEALTAAEMLDEELYTSASWQAFQKAREAAQAVYDDEDAMDKEIQEACASLNQAMEDLEDKADWSELLSLMEKAEEIEAVLDSAYLETGRDAFQKALDEARAMEESASQKEINQMTEKLTLAMAGLRKIPNRDELNDLIAEMEQISLNGYTKASAATFAQALSDLKAAAADETADDETLATAYHNAVDAKDNLEKAETPVKPDRKPSGGKGSSTGSSHTYGAAGTAVVNAAQSVSTQGAYVVSDTTVNFTLKRGSAYCFKMTVQGGANLTPSFTVGNGGVLKTQFVAKIGNDCYYRVWAVGTPGQSTGVYTQLPNGEPQKHCAITIA
ncbi:glycoside hydrolase family 2 TIM barrel-domain containing protein [Anaeromassilibacillus senegalensis]|uniref:glycoside hydrolase family 2 TIM barrel-domain containing protein n=1 Tax=Anaeromassilibacillus senegalensis TaxID=1673717 RepID=UPI0009E391AF|nr:glycoside hydrolase family 2 TIM barrel-domain containing protein [Anaeromassilibacillus senegalensis]